MTSSRTRARKKTWRSGLLCACPPQIARVQSHRGSQTTPTRRRATRRKPVCSAGYLAAHGHRSTKKGGRALPLQRRREMAVRVRTGTAARINRNSRERKSTLSWTIVMMPTTTAMRRAGKATRMHSMGMARVAGRG